MKVVAKAPARIGLLGNPSDLNGGKVIAQAIDLYAFVEVQEANKFEIELKHPPKTIKKNWKELVGDNILIRACLKQLSDVLSAKDLNTIKISYWSEIPFQTGLGGSSSICVACLAALREYFQLKINDFELAERATRAELIEMGNTAGQQDRYASVFGGTIFMDFKGKEKQTINDPYGKYLHLENIFENNAYKLWFVPIERGEASGGKLSRFREAFVNSEDWAIEINNKLKQIADAGLEAFSNKDIEKIGTLMTRNQMLVEKITGKLDNLGRFVYEKALKLGALGARMCGSSTGAVFIADEQTAKKLSREFGVEIIQAKEVKGVRIIRE
ncbi:MAG: hypothetical protein J7L14_02840 [Candidatus Diapherotrites archaeon]|nr:hypothetical protein [Candidatus Diapherotrites archaeon]